MIRLKGRISTTPLISFSAIFLLLVAVAPVGAIEEPTGDSPVADRAFRADHLRISAFLNAPGELPQIVAEQAARDLARLGIERPETARLDLRSSRWATLLPSETLLPGLSDEYRGFSVASRPTRPTENEVWQAFVGYLSEHRAELFGVLGRHRECE